MGILSAFNALTFGRKQAVALERAESCRLREAALKKEQGIQFLDLR